MKKKKKAIPKALPAATKSAPDTLLNVPPRLGPVRTLSDYDHLQTLAINIRIQAEELAEIVEAARTRGALVDSSGGTWSGTCLSDLLQTMDRELERIVATAAQRAGLSAA